MNRKYLAFILLIALASSLQLGMARRGQYDEEAREQERLEKQADKEDKHPGSHVKRMAQGVKEATVDSTTGLIGETAESTKDEPPILGTIEGARKGSGKVLDSTVKGAYKVATLGYGGTPTYEVKEPETESGEPTKVKIKIPGT